MSRPRKTPLPSPDNFITLSDAAKKYNVAPELLTLLIKDGKIKAVKIGGQFAVPERKVKPFARPKHNRDSQSNGERALNLAEAKREFGIGRTSLWRWIKEGRIQVLNPGTKRGFLLREDDVRRIKELHEKGELRQGRALEIAMDSK
ncbi:MAG: hypothetical protein HZC40_00875 [Chloroflexi bacterium]|nr:hypothetical protein [Chloroflexota bacterium]